MPNALRRYAASDLDWFPDDDGNRYELIRGELVVSPCPSVRHQRVVQRLAWRLANYLQPLGLLETLFSVPADITWDDENRVEPDLLVTHLDEITDRWTSIRNLRLAVEVISPSSRVRDRTDKRTLYQDNLVETYWVVDADTNTVEEWHPDDSVASVYRESLRWSLGQGIPALTIHLPSLFEGLP